MCPSKVQMAVFFFSLPVPLLVNVVFTCETFVFDACERYREVHSLHSLINPHSILFVVYVSFSFITCMHYFDGFWFRVLTWTFKLKQIWWGFALSKLCIIICGFNFRVGIPIKLGDNIFDFVLWPCILKRNTTALTEIVSFHRFFFFLPVHFFIDGGKDWPFSFVLHVPRFYFWIIKMERKLIVKMEIKLKRVAYSCTTFSLSFFFCGD